MISLSDRQKALNLAARLAPLLRDAQGVVRVILDGEVVYVGTPYGGSLKVEKPGGVALVSRSRRGPSTLESVMPGVGMAPGWDNSVGAFEAFGSRL